MAILLYEVSNVRSIIRFFVYDDRGNCYIGLLIFKLIVACVVVAIGRGIYLGVVSIRHQISTSVRQYEVHKLDEVRNESSAKCADKSGLGCFKLSDAEARLGNVETAVLLRVRSYQLWDTNCRTGHSESCELLAMYKKGTLTHNCQYTDFACFNKHSHSQNYHSIDPWSDAMHNGIADLAKHSEVKCEFVKVELLTRTTCTK